MRKTLILLLILFTSCFVFPQKVEAACSSFIIEPTNGTFADTFFFRVENCTQDISNYRVRFTSPTAETTERAFNEIPGSGGKSGIFSFQGSLLPAGAYIIDLLENGTSIRQTTITITESEVPPPANPPLVPQGPGRTSEQVSEGCDDENFINTGIGCIPINDINALTKFFLGWALGIAGGVALLMIGFAGYRIATSQGDPRRLQGGQELLMSAIGGLLMVVLSVYLLRFIGVDLLGLF